MKIEFHRLLMFGARILGPWLLVVISRVVAAGYFCFSRRTGESHRLYAALFPARSGLYHRWCTFRQYQNFTTIHLDRLLANLGRPVAYRGPGPEQLTGRIGQGAILLMSHLGNWEMAARLLMARSGNLRILLYMGIKEKEGVEAVQKEELRRAGVKIIGVHQDESAPFSAVEGIRLLQEGGLVSMAGDIIWRADQRRLPVSFLGHRAYLAEAPFVFALVSGAPLLVFFALRDPGGGYQCRLSEPIYVQAASRDERRQALAAAAQRYADLLAETLRAHPLEWYHFDRFIHEVLPVPPPTA